MKFPRNIGTLTISQHAGKSAVFSRDLTPETGQLGWVNRQFWFEADRANPLRTVGAGLEQH
jgi:hypothetical protein